MRFFKGGRTAGVLAASGLIALVAGACSKPKQEAAADPPLAVTVAQVELRPLSGGLAASGLLIPREEAAVTSELSGYRVSGVLVEEGAWVIRGQELARLDDTLLRSQIDQQAAALVQQEVAAERAESEAKRVEGLDNQGVLSQEAIIERRLQAKSARAGVAYAQAQLNDLKTRQTRMVIRAPVSGRVLERSVRPGDTASPSATMFRIVRDGLVELDAETPESELSQIHPGDRVQVQIPSGATVDGAVRIVSPRVDAQTKLGHVRIALPSRPDLRAGGFGRAVFTAATRPTLAAPEAAIRFDADGPSMVVIQANDTARRVAVKTGRRAQGYVELTEGPPPGTRVALGGSAFLVEGDKVRPVAPGSAAPAARNPAR